MQLVKETFKEREQAQDAQRDRSKRQRAADDGKRRVNQRRLANPNVLPPAVVAAFSGMIVRDSGNDHEWCPGGVLTPTILANGLPPPQCLLDFLDHGGRPDAHLPSEEPCSGETLLQLAAENCGPRVVKLLLEHGADVNGTLSKWSPLESALEGWYPIRPAHGGSAT